MKPKLEANEIVCAVLEHGRKTVSLDEATEIMSKLYPNEQLSDALHKFCIHNHFIYLLEQTEKDGKKEVVIHFTTYKANVR